MSGKFTNTTTSFGVSSLRQEEWIREVVQNEMLGILDDIKFEIESKIKSIDQNITDIRRQMKVLKDSRKGGELGEVLEKLDKVEAQVQVLKYNQQLTLKSSRTRSLDKERKPIFKKGSSESYDFSSVILGLEEAEVKSETRIADLRNKPPLPPSPSQHKTISVPNREKSPGRNPVLEDSGSIHRWLHESRSREPSCFGEVIKQEQIEESVYI